MFKSIKGVLFAVCVVMLFTAQTKRPDDNKKQNAPSRPVNSAHNNQPAPQVKSNREAPQHNQTRQPSPSHRESPGPIEQRQKLPVQTNNRQSFHQGAQQPRVYATPAVAPATNNRLLHRQHHKNWQPRYNFYDNEYHFYPYVNIASTVELSGQGYSIVFNGQNYFYDQGTFYLQDSTGQYVAVAPPIGIIVNPIAANARQIVVDNQIYYRYKGIFYIQVPQGYQVVGPVQPDPGN